MLLLTLEFIAASLWIVLFWYLRRRRLGRLPPGPTPVPILGNILDIPNGALWKNNERWKLVYGPIVHTRTLGQSVITLTELDDAIALLEKRSLNYSDRILTPMMRLSNWDFALGFIPFGEQWKARRKMLDQSFHQAAIGQYTTIQEKWAHRLLDWLRDSPERFSANFTRFAASIVVEITYGHEAEGEDDELMTLIASNLNDAIVTLEPGRYLVDAVPILEKLPTWFPGTSSFRNAGTTARKAIMDMINIPFQRSLPKAATGQAGANVMSRLYAQLDPQDGRFDIQKKELRDATGIIYLAGVDTTTITLENILLLLVANPDAQDRARAEVRRVTGGNRLPAVSDRSSLPYVEAFVKETLRLLTAVPQGIPHAVTDSDVYKGYNIPAQSFVMADAWCILHDSKHYRDPFDFRPERFIGKNPERDPQISGAFGFGRRICPGRYFATSTLVLVTACIISQFEIKHALDPDGDPIPVVVDQLPGMTSHPLPFRCILEPLSTY